MAAVVGTVGSLALMRPQRRDSGHAEGGVDDRSHPVWPWCNVFRAGRHLVDVHEPFPPSPDGQTGKCLRGVEDPPGRWKRIDGHPPNGML